MENQMRPNARKRTSELLHSNRLVILLEVILVLAPTYVCLILGYRPDHDFISLGGDLVLLGGPLIYVGMVFSLVLFWVAASIRGAGWQTFGLSRPASWIRAGLSGVGVAIVMIVAITFLQELLTMAFPDAVPPDISRFGVLHGSLPNLILNVVVIWLTAGLVEELIWRAYLMNRVADILGEKRLALVASLFCSAALFGIVHFYQGPSGMLLSGVIGLLFGVAYLVRRRNLWPLVIAHGLINTVSFVNVFLNGI